MVSRGLKPGQRLEQRTGFFGAAAPQLGNHQGRRHSNRDLIGIQGQDSLVRASEAVFGQHRDGLEQGRAHSVVEILAGNVLLAGMAEAPPDVLRERP